MDRNKIVRSPDLRFLLRAAVGWLAAALFLLPLGAAIITLADLKASSFPLFGAGISFLSAVAAGFMARGRDAVPSWQIACLSAVMLTIVLLTTGFLIVGEDMGAESILFAALPTAAGCFSGVFLAARLKKLQKRGLPFKKRKLI